METSYSQGLGRERNGERLLRGPGLLLEDDGNGLQLAWSDGCKTLRSHEIGELYTSNG